MTDVERIDRADKLAVRALELVAAGRAEVTESTRLSGIAAESF